MKQIFYTLRPPLKLLILLGAAGALAAAAPTSSVAPTSSAPPSGASAPPSGSSVPVAALPTISGTEVPNEPSKIPSAAEWSTAKAVRVGRGDQGPCAASLVREWLRLRCPGWIGGGLVAGDPRGVYISTFGTVSDENNALTTLILPVQRGKARIVSFLQIGQEYNSAAYAEGGMLSIVWQTGHPDPVLVMTRRP